MNCHDCELYGPCNGRHGCAKVEQPKPADTINTELDLWVPTIAFFMGVAIGGGMVLEYLRWML